MITVDSVRCLIDDHLLVVVLNVRFVTNNFFELFAPGTGLDSLPYSTLHHSQI